MKHLPSSIKLIWLQSVGFSTLGWIILLSLYFWGMHVWSWLPKGLFIAIVILALIELVTEIALIPYRYAFYKYEVNETDVEIKKGFFFRKHVSIPIARVQNVDMDQGPLLRFQKLFSVTIATGGSSHKIEALHHDDAKRLKDQVMQLAREARNAK